MHSAYIYNESGHLVPYAVVAHIWENRAGTQTKYILIRTGRKKLKRWQVIYLPGVD